MSRRGPELDAEAEADRASGHAAVALALLSLGLLVFTWPFVRAPPLHLVPSYLHMLAAWLLVIAGLAVLARALSRARRGGRRA